MNVLCQFIIYILSTFYPMNKILISRLLCFFFRVCEPSIILCINCNKIGVVMAFWNREYIFHCIHALNICMNSVLPSPLPYFSTHLCRQVDFPSFLSVEKSFVSTASSAHFSSYFFQFCLCITLLLSS